MNPLFERALNLVKENRERRIKGGVNSIPFKLDKLNSIIPGLQKGNYTIISAGTGVGKSKLTKFLYVINTVEFVMEHPELNIKLNIFYFALEENAENFYLSIMVYKLFKDYGLIIPIKKLKSITMGEVIDDSVINKLESMRDWFDEFKKRIRVIDDIRNPTGIVKEMEKYLNEKAGKWTYKEIMINNELKKVRDKFVYHRDQHYVVGIIDHIGLLHNESGLNQHQTMTKMSSEYALRLMNKYDCSIIIVQQQAAAAEQKQYTMKGGLVAEKLEPTLQTLGNNKEIAREATEIITLFAPDRYDIANHRGYDVAHLQDNYRSLQVLKSRDGEANIRIGLFFDGRVNIFEELPKAKEITENDYERYAKRIEMKDSMPKFSIVKQSNIDFNA